MSFLNIYINTKIFFQIFTLQPHHTNTHCNIQHYLLSRQAAGMEYIWEAQELTTEMKGGAETSKPIKEKKNSKEGKNKFFVIEEKKSY